MPDWLLSIPAFIVAIGVLVAVHEYGHYWVARRVGVQVRRYAIGFGPRLWSRVSPKTGIEYCICALPLGGYVKMLDEREGPVPPDKIPYAFNRQTVGKRMAVVAAGPGVNFVFAAIAYWVVFILGVPGIKPIIATVPPDSLAHQAELHRGDAIVAVAGQQTRTWQELRLTLLERALDGQPVGLKVRDQQGDTRHTTLNLRHVSPDPKILFKQLGLEPMRPRAPPIIARTLPGQPAARAGLEAGDKVLAAGGQHMQGPQAFVNWIQAHPGQRVAMTIDSNGQQHQLDVVLASKQANGKRIGHLGAAIGVDASAWQAMQTTRQYGPLAAVGQSLHKTWLVSALTVRMLYQMVIGNVSWHNISGPIQIADYAGKTASIGLQAFISFMALISISLGVINLLPVPVLDGGHLLYYACEVVRGRPLSERIQAMGQQVGVVALLLLMSLAFYNDIMRLLG